MKNTFINAAAAFVLAAFILASCAKKEYDCACSVDAPDTLGLSLDFDTTLLVEARSEKAAEVECAVYEEGTSVLMPSGITSDLISINCQLQ